MSKAAETTTELKASRNDYSNVPFELLDIAPEGDERNLYAGRFDYGTDKELEELAISIMTYGVRVPVRGFKENGKYMIRVGNRRYLAGKIAFEKYGKSVSFPFIAYPKNVTRKEMVLDAILTNISKEPTPLERASTVVSLLEEGMTEKEIAAALGNVSLVYVRNLKRLHDAPEAAKNLVRKGVISATFLMNELKSKPNIDFLIDKIEAAVKDKEVIKMPALIKADEEETKTNKKVRVTTKDFKKAEAPKEAPTPKKDKLEIDPADLKIINSFEELKRFFKKGNFAYEDDLKAEIGDFLKQIINNDLDYMDIEKFFTGK